MERIPTLPEMNFRTQCRAAHLRRNKIEHILVRTEKNASYVAFDDDETNNVININGLKRFLYQHYNRICRCRCLCILHC